MPDRLDDRACNMRGHGERGCLGMKLTPVAHLRLMRDGYGVSYVPGPDRAEVDEEGLAMRRRRPDQQ